MSKRKPFGRAVPLYEASVEMHPFGRLVLTGHLVDGSKIIDEVTYIDRSEVGVRQTKPVLRYKILTQGTDSCLALRTYDTEPHPLSPKGRKL